MLCIAALCLSCSHLTILLFHTPMCVREEERIIMLKKKAIGAFVAAATLLSGFAFASLPPVAFASTSGNKSGQTEHNDNDVIQFKDGKFKSDAIYSLSNVGTIWQDDQNITYAQAGSFTGKLEFFHHDLNYPGDVVHSVSNISDLQYFPNVTSVELGEFNNVSNFSPLSHLKNLTSLNISVYNGNKDFSSLPQMNSVRHFRLNASTFPPRVDNQINDLSFISKMPNLETLELDGNILVSDFNFLSRLTKLKKIVMNASPKLSNLSPLKDMKNLEELSIGSSGISDLSPLSGLTSLKKLDLCNSNISDISALKNLTNLTELKLDNNKITNISYISDLANLQELSFINNKVTVSDLSIFSKFTKLKKLIVNVDDNVKNLDAISNLTSLTDLQIAGSKISSLSGLRNLTKLEYVSIFNSGSGTNLDGNAITSLDAISNLTGLKTLMIIGFKISDLSPLKNLAKLSTLHIDVADGVDISKLAGLSNLYELTMLGGKISNLSPLNNIRKLHKLNVKAADNVTDLSSISNLTNLGELDISGRNISNISALAHFTSLYHLMLASFELKDITPLRRADTQPSISNINLQCCENISDYTPLESQRVDALWVNVKAENNESIKKIKEHSNHPTVYAFGCYEFCKPGAEPTPAPEHHDGTPSPADSATSVLDSLTPALDDNIDFSEMLDMADFDVDSLGDLSDSGNMNVGDFTGTDSADNSGDAGIPSGVDDFNIGDFDLSDFDFADLLDDLGDLDLDDLATADVADAGSSVPAVPVGVVAR